MPDKRQRSIAIDEAVLRKVEKAAKEEHRSVNMQIEYILAEWAGKQPRKDPK